MVVRWSIQEDTVRSLEEKDAASRDRVAAFQKATERRRGLVAEFVPALGNVAFPFGRRPAGHCRGTDRGE